MLANHTKKMIINFIPSNIFDIQVLIVATMKQF